MSEVRVLRWKKGEQAQTSWSPEYVAYDEHGYAGSAVRTGRYGADDYPWDWHIEPLHPPINLARNIRHGGSADTLRSAKDQAEQAARLTRDTKGEWKQ